MAFYVASNGGDQYHSHPRSRFRRRAHSLSPLAFNRPTARCAGALSAVKCITLRACQPSRTRPSSERRGQMKYQVLLLLDCGTYAVGVLAATVRKSRVPSA